MTSHSILVVAAHPQIEQSRVNRALIQRASRLDTVQVRDLYALYPDYFIDTAAEQAALASAQLVVWLHPVHWYGMPPLMKLWLDEVFTFGWAYGPGGRALAGKDLWLVTSTGGSEESYRTEGHNRYYFDAFLPPYEQTATLAGLRFLPPFVQHGSHQLSDGEIEGLGDVFAERLTAYPDWPELDEMPMCIQCEVPIDARPETAEPPALSLPTPSLPPRRVP